jgi:urease accessory protein
MTRFQFSLAAALALLAPAAHAHTGAHPVEGFLSGFAHPLAGPDHLLALFGVGLWAVVAAPREAWRLPLAFTALMVLGGALGAFGITLSGVETGIAGSVLLLGLLAAAMARPGRMWAFLLVGVFALCHGHAHGLEMAAGADFRAYASGFTLASVLLQAAGVLLGRRLLRVPALYRSAGGLIGAAGFVLLAHTF